VHGKGIGDRAEVWSTIKPRWHLCSLLFRY
jgi:hypothetical protein